MPLSIETERNIEAGAGIEPANSGFADRDLTTWLPRRLARNERNARPQRVNAARRCVAAEWSDGVVECWSQKLSVGR